MTTLPAIQQVRADLDANEDRIAANLPPGISIDKFRSVVLTAVARKPELLRGDRQSLVNSCVMCAQDGLLPDGREAALTIYKTKMKDDSGRESWIEAVQYMPMVYGIRKRLHAAGEVRPPITELVYRNDTFRHWTDETGPHLLHEPATFADRGEVVGVFALARGKDGAVYVEVMTKAEIEKIRSKSKAATSGPWVDWWGEMARKSVLRRLAKSLPMGAETERMFAIEDERDNAPMIDAPPPRPALSDFSEPQDEPSGQIYRVTDEFGEVAYEGPEKFTALEMLRTMAAGAADEDRESLRDSNDLWDEAVGDHTGKEFGLPPLTEDGEPLNLDAIKAEYQGYKTRKDSKGCRAWASALVPGAKEYVRKLMAEDGAAAK